MIMKKRESQSAAAEDSIEFHGVFRSPFLENAFRRHYLKDDRTMAGACLALAVGGGLVYTLVDYRLFNLTRQFYLLLEVRLLSYLVVLMGWQALRRCTRPASFDRLVLLLCFFGAMVSVYVNATRAPGQIGHAMVSVLVLALTYSVVPLPLLSQSLWAVLYSIAFVACMPEHGVSGGGPTASHSIMLAFAAANVLGVVVSWRLNQRRRIAFAAMLRERDLRFRLEHALAEMRTLQGIHRICAWCKNVRDEDSGWQSVEDFVQDRSHARFTHGICPICFQKHFGELEEDPRNSANGVD